MTNQDHIHSNIKDLINNVDLPLWTDSERDFIKSLTNLQTYPDIVISERMASKIQALWANI